MNKQEFGQLYDSVLAPWADSRQPDVKAAYWRNLAGINPDRLREAFAWIGQNWRREQGMPTPGDIRSAAERQARDVATAPRAPLPPAVRNVLSTGIRKILETKHWEPSTDAERAGACLFREILAAHHGVRMCGRENGHPINQWPVLEGPGLRAFNDFGGREALALVDEETVMLARKTFAKAYAKASQP